MITFETITKQFGDGSYALQDVSFAIDPGELVMITGPSGSGKTTLMRLLTMEYKPTQGEITFFDTPLSQVKSGHVYQHRRQIGVVFQDYKLLPEYNVWENIALPLYIVGKSTAEIESRVTDLLKLVNLTEKAYLFPNQLSGGEAQRVSIARALATGPSVIFADEPTGNLDPETSLSIAKLLKTINELGTTILFATHDLGVLKALADERHIKLDNGHLVKDTKVGIDRKAPAKAAKVDKIETNQQPSESKSSETKPESHDTTVATEPTATAKPAKKKRTWKLPSWPKKKPEVSAPTQVTVEELEPDQPSESVTSKKDKAKKEV